jgi:hypothetical protein
MANIPTTEEIERLVAAGAAESTTREFKAAPWERNDQGKREALKDITAMANTRGGLILIGVAEENNAATALAPITPEAAEAERSRINDLVTAGVEPRLYGVGIEAVPVVGGVILSLHIPRSPSRPHRVTSGGWNRFWLRNSTGTYEANVADLKNLFLQSAGITERAERHHRERVAVIRGGDIVANLADAPSSVILHVIHGDAFSGASIVDPMRAFELQKHFKPLSVFDSTPRFTFDGFLNLRGGEKCHGYTLVRRDGIVESIKVKLANDPKKLPVFDIEASVVNWMLECARGLSELEIVPPYYVYVTLESAGGRRIHLYPDDDDSDPILRRDLHLPVAVIEDWKGPAAIGAAFKPAFDAIWNAGGFAGSLSYETGAWVQKARQL